MPEPNKILGLDGKLYQEIQGQTEQINEEVKKKTIPETGMIMDGTNDYLKQNLDETPKLDEETLQKIIAYQNKKPSIREYKKIGRNDPCPCGSGKKYKNCCLKTGKYEKLIKEK